MKTKTSLLIKNQLIKNAWAYAIILVVSYAFKYHYSQAASHELIWILAPTAKLAGWFSGLTFIYESGAGYINLARNICIAPACAGVNFLIISFCLIAMTGIYRISSSRDKLLWVFLSGAVSYVLTLLVNACRIVLSIRLYESDFYHKWVSPGAMHQLMGIILYLGFLYVVFYLMHYLFPRRGHLFEHASFHFLFPLVIYLSVTILVPLLNNAHKLYGRQFWTHSFWVASVGFGIYGLIVGVRLGYVMVKNNFKMKIYP